MPPHSFSEDITSLRRSSFLSVDSTTALVHVLTDSTRSAVFATTSLVLASVKCWNIVVRDEAPPSTTAAISDSEARNVRDGSFQNGYAVVTGANKGIGFEICRQLASKGITVVLTARDEKRGLEAVEKMKEESGLSDFVIFHQLDVMDSESVGSLADFVKSQFGKLDILVNNAGILGAIVDSDAFRAAIEAVRAGTDRAKISWNAMSTMTYDLALEALQTNYYGAKRTTEALLPLLQSSPSPRIVNVSSSMGKLKNIPNAWAKGVLNDAENLTEERIDQVLNEFLKSLKEGSIEAKGWPQYLGAYILSKAAMCADTRILARKYPSFRINCLCPGFVSTEMNFHTGIITTEEGAEGPVMLALLPDDGPSGLFFLRKEVSSFEE